MTKNKNMPNHSKKLFILSFALTLLLGGLFFVSAAWAQDLGIGKIGETAGLAGTDIRIVIAKIIRAALGFLGVIVLCLMLYAGYLWMTAGGNEEKITEAKTLIKNSIIGLAIILSAYAITSFVISSLLKVTDPLPSHCYNGILESGEPFWEEQHVTDSRECGGECGDCDGGGCPVPGGCEFKQVFQVEQLPPSGDVCIRNYHPVVLFSEPPKLDNLNNSSFPIVRIVSTSEKVDGVWEYVEGTGEMAVKFVPSGTSAVCGDGIDDCFEAGGIYELKLPGGNSDGVISREGYVNGDGVLEAKNLNCSAGVGCGAVRFVPGPGVDRTVPAITLTAPSTATRGDNVGVSVSSTDDFGLQSLYLFVDGAPTPVDTASIPRCEKNSHFDLNWDTTGWRVGAAGTTYNLRALGADWAAHTASSSRSIDLLSATDAECVAGNTCSKNSDCCTGFCSVSVSGFGVCERRLEIRGLDPSSGAPGNYVSINGRYFGSTPGKVYFAGRPNVFPNLYSDPSVEQSIPAVDANKYPSSISITPIVSPGTPLAPKSAKKKLPPPVAIPAVPPTNPVSSKWEHLLSPSAHSGDAMLKVEKWSSDPGSYIFIFKTPTVAINPNKQYVVSVYARSPKVGAALALSTLGGKKYNFTAQRFVTGSECSSVVIDDCVNKFALTTEWRKYEYKISTSDLTAINNLYFSWGLHGGATDATTTVYLDDFDIREYNDQFVWTEAQLPCDPKRAWSDNQIIAQVPTDAVSGPIMVSSSASDTRAGSIKVDITDNSLDYIKDNWGLNLDFTVNTTSRPGLCSIAPPSSTPGSEVYIAGNNFSTFGTGVYFGNTAALPKSWSSTGEPNDWVFAVVPQLAGGAVGVRVKNNIPGGNTDDCRGNNVQCSNSVRFVVKSGADVPGAEGISNAEITDMSTRAGAAGEYIVITGRNFGENNGLVWFRKENDKNFTVNGNINFPGHCGDIWSDGRILVKFPSGSDLEQTKYFVQVRPAGRDASAIDEDDYFEFVGGEPAPGICALSNYSGPVPFSPLGLSVFGDYFDPRGGSTTSTKVYFSATGGNSVSGRLAAEIISSSSQIMQVRPLDQAIVSGPVVVYRESDGKVSNEVDFIKKDCLGGSACGANEQCCGAFTQEPGVCIPDDGRLCRGGTRSAGYMWRFSTREIPAPLRVVEKCDAQVMAGLALPSPSPSLLWKIGGNDDQENVCRNALISIEFSRGDVNLINNILPGNDKNALVVLECRNGMDSTQRECLRSETVTVVNNGDANGVLLPSESSRTGAVSGHTYLSLKPTSTYNNGSGNWKPNTWYQVKLYNDIRANGPKSSPSSTALVADRPCGDDTAYCFAFHTDPAGKQCELDKVIVTPYEYWTNHLEAPLRGRTPSGREYELFYKGNGLSTLRCIMMDVSGYGWNWRSASTSFANIYSGTSTMDRAQVSALRNTVAVPGLTGNAVNILADATTSTVTKTGTSSLTIDLSNPQVVDYWPKCQEACLNSEVGVRFNIAMFSGNLQTAVQLYKCEDVNCLVTSVTTTLPSNSVTPNTIIFNQGILSPDTYYKVVVSNQYPGDLSSPSAPNDVLWSLGDLFDLSVFGKPYNKQLTWKFKTKKESCKIDRVDVLPEVFSTRRINDQTFYKVTPYSAPDACSVSGQRLNAYSVGWNWDSSNDDVATVEPFRTLGQNKNCTDRCVRKGSDVPFATIASGAVDRFIACGNGMVEPGEDCDPPSATGGCTLSCLYSGNTDLTNTVSEVDIGKCGDGFVSSTKGEECDPGSSDPRLKVNCNASNCLRTGSTATPKAENVTASVCGDGAVTVGEECDLAIPYGYTIPASDQCSDVVIGPAVGVDDVSEVNSIAFGHSPNALAVGGNYIYVVMASSGLWVVDASNGSSPQIVAQDVEKDNYELRELSVSGNYLYALASPKTQLGRRALLVFDISIPSSPQLQSAQFVSNGGSPVTSIFASGSYVYIGGPANGSLGYKNLLAYNIAVDPANPAPANGIAFYSDQFAAADSIFVAGSHAYIIDNTDDKLVIVDVRNPQSGMPVVSMSSVGTNVNNISILGNYVYLTDRDSNNLLVVDILDPANPVLRNTAGLGSGSPSGLSVSGGYAFVIFDSTAVNNISGKFNIIDISNPVEPTVARKLLTNTSYGASDIVVLGNYGYITSYGAGTMKVFELPHPEVISQNCVEIPASEATLTSARNCSAQCLHTGTRMTNFWCQDNPVPYLTGFATSTYNFYCNAAYSQCGDGVTSADEDPGCEKESTDSDGVDDGPLFAVPTENGCNEFCKKVGDGAPIGSSLLYSAPSVCGDGEFGMGEVAYCENDSDPDFIEYNRGATGGFDPWVLAKGVGAGVTSTAAVGGSAAQVSNIIATTDSSANQKTAGGTSKSDSGRYEIQCGYSNDGECVSIAGLPDDNSYGVGGNSCCYARPRLMDNYPASSTTNVCLNTTISASFDHPIDRASITGNFLIARSVATTTCPGGSENVTSLIVAQDAQQLSWPKRVLNRVLVWFADLFGRHSASADIWCAGADTGSVDVLNGRFRTSTLSFTTSTLKVNLKRPLAANADYKIILAGDIKDYRGVKLGVSEKFGFTTGEEICEVDSVSLSPSEVYFDESGATTTMLATAYTDASHSNQQISSIPEFYAWDYRWGPAVSASNPYVQFAVPTTSAAIEGGRNVLAALNKNGELDVYATADVVENDYSSRVGPVATGKAHVIVFLCDNPWPPKGLAEFGVNIVYPYEDKLYNNDNFDLTSDRFNGNGIPPSYVKETGTSGYYNFRTYYCADAGGSGSDDDLPYLRAAVQNAYPQLETAKGSCNLTGEECNIYATPSAACGDCIVQPQLLKRFIFTDSADRVSDAVGIQVFSNQYFLTPREWLAGNKLAGGKDFSVNNFRDLQVDGYNAVSDGNNIYVEALNFSENFPPEPNNLKSEIYLFSLSQNAGSEMKNVFEQFMNNLTLNTNLDNDRYCVDDLAADPPVLSPESAPCQTDLDCAAAGHPEQKCANKIDKLKRNYGRLRGLGAIEKSLESYAAKNAGKYPVLTEGTYLSGQTVSTWPSWSVLGSAVGRGLAIDPINRLAQAGSCAYTTGGTAKYCLSDADCDSSIADNKCLLHDATTNWLTTGTSTADRRFSFACNPTSLAYRYIAATDAPDYTVRYLLEENNLSSAFAPLIPKFIATPARFPNNGICLGSEEISTMQSGFCGDGKLNLNLGEQCDPPGAIEYGVCNTSDIRTKKTCLATCKWSTTATEDCYDVKNCGNGKLDPGEACDDGVLNGRYGRCAVGCLAVDTLRCGDGVVTAPYEFCDTVPVGGSGKCSFVSGSGLLAGTEICTPYASIKNNSCKSDCSALGSYCGDNVVDSPNEDCEIDQPCTTDDGASGIQECANCQLVGACVAAPVATPEVVVNPECGNGNVESEFEACDDSRVDAGLGNYNNNGQVCEPGYNRPCTYCSADCSNVIRKEASGWCGDGIINPGSPERCEDGVVLGANTDFIYISATSTSYTTQGGRNDDTKGFRLKECSEIDANLNASTSYWRKIIKDGPDLGAYEPFIPKKAGNINQCLNNCTESVQACTICGNITGGTEVRGNIVNVIEPTNSNPLYYDGSGTFHYGTVELFYTDPSRYMNTGAPADVHHMLRVGVGGTGGGSAYALEEGSDRIASNPLAKVNTDGRCYARDASYGYYLTINEWRSGLNPANPNAPIRRKLFPVRADATPADFDLLLSPRINATDTNYSASQHSHIRVVLSWMGEPDRQLSAGFVTAINNPTTDPEVIATEGASLSRVTGRRYFDQTANGEYRRGIWYHGITTTPSGLNMESFTVKTESLGADQLIFYVRTDDNSSIGSYRQNGKVKVDVYVPDFDSDAAGGVSGDTRFSFPVKTFYLDEAIVSHNPAAAAWHVFNVKHLGSAPVASLPVSFDENYNRIITSREYLRFSY